MVQHFDAVRIWEENRKARVITDVERAAEWLLFHWPEGHLNTLQHLAARKACLKAQEGKVPPQYARAAFVVAAEAAGILAPAFPGHRGR